MWLPAHTPARRLHAEEGKRWRWHGDAYEVNTVLGEPEDVGDFVWVGLQPLIQLHSTHRRLQVGPGWGDHDVDSEGRPVSPAQKIRPLHRLHQRIASWFDNSLVEG
jgi:hypothetical protein